MEKGRQRELIVGAMVMMMMMVVVVVIVAVWGKCNPGTLEIWLVGGSVEQGHGEK